MTTFIQFQMRRDTTANWTSANPILGQGELGLDTTLNRFKIGDGTTVYNSLGYAPNTVFAGTGAPAGGLGVNGDIYFDTTSGATKLYGPKAAGSWGSGVTLTGATGAPGTPGTTGATGPGVVVGGAAHQALTKIDATNFNTQWETINPAFVGSPPVGRLINTTAPLTGGGDLSADRTHALSMSGTGNALGVSGAIFHPKDIDGTVYISAGNPQGWSGSDIGAWVNAAFAYLVANYATGVNGGTIKIGSGSFNQSTPIDIGQLGFSIILEGNGDGNGSTILNYTPTTGIALGIGGASGNDGGVQVRNLTLTGSSAANATTAIRWGASTVGTAGASAWNVSIRRFGIGMDWRTGSVTYAVNLFNCKVQQCTTGIKPAGEANNMFGGLLANNATGMDASNSGTDFEGFGVAFDDNTTWAINAASTTFRGTLTSCRFENAGAGTSNYITMSNGSLCVIGGSFQDDVNTGSATGFVQCTGGNFYLAGTWIASVGRTYVNPFVMGTAMTNVQISGVLAPGSSGIAAKQLTVNGGNLSGNATGTATASFSTVATQVLPVFVPAPGEVQPNSTYKFEIHAQVINTATATNLVAQVLVGGVAVGAAASTALGTVAHATPGQVYLITGFITFPSTTTAESLVVIVPAGGSTVNAHGGTTTAAIAVAANAALQVNLSTSGATSTVIVRHSYVTKVY